MALPAGARLPMLFSAAMGLCALGAGVYEANGLLRQHADGGQTACVSVFALAICALWAWGYARSWQFLGLCAREEAALPAAAAKLAELGQDVENRVKEGAKVAPKPLSPDTPQLNRRVGQLWRAIQRGAPLWSGEGSRAKSARPGRIGRSAW